MSEKYDFYLLHLSLDTAQSQYINCRLDGAWCQLGAACCREALGNTAGWRRGVTLWDEREETAGGQREERASCPALQREREVSHVRDPGEVTR